MALELDSETLAVLHGTDRPRDTEAHGVDGANYRVITRPGRRTIPPFSMNDLQLKAVITQVTLTYIFRNKKVPAGFGTDLTVLEREAADDWMATIAAVAYRSWRMRWHIRDVANSLAMTDARVMGLLAKMRQQAELMGYDVGPHGHTGKLNGSEADILAAWAGGMAVGAINRKTGACKARIRHVLKKNCVWYKRGTSRPNLIPYRFKKN